eukprot:11329-Heterococcus_DN1.PRE.3
MVLLYSLFERELQHKSMQQAAAYLVISCCLNKSVQLSLTGNVHDYELRHMCCCYRHGWTTATRCIMKKSQLFRQQHAQCADICVLTALVMQHRTACETVHALAYCMRNGCISSTTWNLKNCSIAVLAVQYEKYNPI